MGRVDLEGGRGGGREGGDRVEEAHARGNLLAALHEAKQDVPLNVASPRKVVKGCLGILLLGPKAPCHCHVLRLAGPLLQPDSMHSKGGMLGRGVGRGREENDGKIG